MIVVVLTVMLTVDAAGAEVGLPVGADIGACVVRLVAAQAVLAASKTNSKVQYGMAIQALIARSGGRLVLAVHAHTAILVFEHRFRSRCQARGDANRDERLPVYVLG